VSNMIEFIYSLLDSYSAPLLSAFLIGLLMAISPCPFATNITAIAYVSRNIKSKKYIVFSGLFYALGRAISYTALSVLIFFGFSSFQIARIFQGWGDKVLGPILIIIGLVMLNLIKINLQSKYVQFEKVKQYLSTRGYLGSLLLGILFALAFCPYSGVLFFAMFIPLALQSSQFLLLPLVFSLGTALPVIIFTFLLVFSLGFMSKAFKFVQKIEKVLRYFVAFVFILSGLYYLQYLIKYLLSL